MTDIAKPQPSELANVILGGQDGLVNVLGVILGLAAASSGSRIILAGGLAATFAESISMAAVAYTSKTDLCMDSRSKVLFDSLIVGVSALVGSVLPLTPFFFLPVQKALVLAIAVSILTLAAVGAYKGKVTVGRPARGALQILLIGMGAAVAGYLIGLLFKA